MKKIVASFFIFLNFSIAYAANFERNLQNVQLRDSAGLPFNSDALRLNRNWVLLIIDSSLPSAKIYLSNLVSAGSGLDERMTILVLGKAEKISGFNGFREKLPGVRWVFSEDIKTIKELGLSGTPTLLGIRPNHTFAWQKLGASDSAGKMVDQIKSWAQMDGNSQ